MPKMLDCERGARIAELEADDDAYSHAEVCKLRQTRTRMRKCRMQSPSYQAVSMGICSLYKALKCRIRCFKKWNPRNETCDTTDLEASKGTQTRGSEKRTSIREDAWKRYALRRLPSLQAGTNVISIVEQCSL